MHGNSAIVECILPRNLFSSIHCFLDLFLQSNIVFEIKLSLWISLYDVKYICYKFKRYFRKLNFPEVNEFQFQNALNFVFPQPISLHYLLVEAPIKKEYKFIRVSSSISCNQMPELICNSNMINMILGSNMILGDQIDPVNIVLCIQNY